MQRVIVSGSLAYDRIMNFSDNFSNHILPDKIHNLNVCFQVDGVTENFGGTAGNIAYALRLLGEEPVISATIGRDHLSYFSWFDQHSITTDCIKVISEEFTAGAYITTDLGNNQITGFNPGAMKYSSDLEVNQLSPENDLLLISPGNLDDMVKYPGRCRELGVNYIFDPGQSLPMLQAEDLREVISYCMVLIVNDYEFNMIQDKLSLTKEQLLSLSQNSIITLGAEGSEVYCNGQKTRISACTAAKVVDPTGAGDCYRAGLVSGLINGEDIITSAKRGSAASSFAVESAGTQVYSFTIEEFAARLATI